MSLGLLSLLVGELVRRLRLRLLLPLLLASRHEGLELAHGNTVGQSGRGRSGCSSRLLVLLADRSLTALELAGIVALIVVGQQRVCRILKLLLLLLLGGEQLLLLAAIKFLHQVIAVLLMLLLRLLLLLVGALKNGIDAESPAAGRRICGRRTGLMSPA